jgi:hypothetical protein
VKQDPHKTPRDADQIPVGDAAESGWGDFVEAVKHEQPPKSATVTHYQRLAAEATLKAGIVAGLDMLHPGRATQVLEAATIHHPRCGNARRSYLSLGDVMAYEAGHISFDPTKPGPTQRTPFYDGWWDAWAENDARLYPRDDDGGEAVPA